MTQSRLRALTQNGFVWSQKNNWKIQFPPFWFASSHSQSTCLRRGLVLTCRHPLEKKRKWNKFCVNGCSLRVPCWRCCVFCLLVGFVEFSSCIIKQRSSGARTRAVLVWNARDATSETHDYKSAHHHKGKGVYRCCRRQQRRRRRRLYGDATVNFYLKINKQTRKKKRIHHKKWKEVTRLRAT